jgi:hypothetical protein
MVELSKILLWRAYKVGVRGKYGTEVLIMGMII